jgi:hypothetical protein
MHVQVPPSVDSLGVPAPSDDLTHEALGYSFRRFVQYPIDRRFDAFEAFAAGLKVAQFVVAVEHVKRRDELVFETVDDRVVVVDSNRLNELHLFECIFGNGVDIEFVFGPRLVHRNERHARVRESIAPYRKLFGRLVAKITTLRPKRYDDGKTAQFFGRDLTVYPRGSPLQ